MSLKFTILNFRANFFLLNGVHFEVLVEPQPAAASANLAARF